jgi:hypothetical protein
VIPFGENPCEVALKQTKLNEIFFKDIGGTPQMKDHHMVG